MISSQADSQPAVPPINGRLTALKERDEDAWTIAFRNLWPVALRAGMHPELRLTPAEAEEVASEALASLVSRIENIDTFEELAALAATIAYRRAVSVSRWKFAAKRQPAAGEQGGVDTTHDDTAAPERFYDQLSDIELRDLTLLLRDSLSEVDEDTHLLIHEKIVMGSSYEELSAKHKMPLGTVCAKVARGLRKIRQRLEQTPKLMKELREHLR